MHPSLDLAHWIHDVPRAWSRPGQAMALQAVGDTALCAVAGAGDISPVVAACDPTAGGRPIPGHPGVLLTPDAAALAWGLAIHSRELDDQTYSMGGHLMATLLPALLLYPSAVPSSWEALADAVVVGCEVASGLNRAMTRQHMERGWVATTTYGLVAAVAGIARLHAFEARQTLAAIALACNKAFGNKNLFGTPAKAVNVGLAARDAVLLARLAHGGLRASDEPLEGAFGFGTMYRGDAEPDWSRLVAEPSANPAILGGLAFKRHACCASAHRCADGVLQLRAAHGVRPRDVESIRAEVGPLNRLTLRYPRPATAAEALFSMPFILSSALRFGELGPGRFTPDAVADAATLALLDRVEMDLVAEAKVPGFVERVPVAHRVELRLKDGSRLHCEVLHPRGAPANPFDAADWALKFDHCTVGVVAEPARTRMQTLLRELPASSVEDLLACVCGFSADHDPAGRRFAHQGARSD
jgi:2-methylcitrate dehydratase PrpD